MNCPILEQLLASLVFRAVKLLQLGGEPNAIPGMDHAKILLQTSPGIKDIRGAN